MAAVGLLALCKDCIICFQNNTSPTAVTNVTDECKQLTCNKQSTGVWPVFTESIE